MHILFLFVHCRSSYFAVYRVFQFSSSLTIFMARHFYIILCSLFFVFTFSSSSSPSSLTRSSFLSHFDIVHLISVQFAHLFVNNFHLDNIEKEEEGQRATTLIIFCYFFVFSTIELCVCTVKCFAFLLFNLPYCSFARTENEIIFSFVR